MLEKEHGSPLLDIDLYELHVSVTTGSVRTELELCFREYRVRDMVVQNDLIRCCSHQESASQTKAMALKLRDKGQHAEAVALEEKVTQLEEESSKAPSRIVYVSPGMGAPAAVKVLCEMRWGWSA